MRYLDSLKTADRQFRDIMDLLTESGILENSILIVFSDHGEAFLKGAAESASPRAAEIYEQLAMTPDSKPGHGTDLHTQSQYRVFIAAQDRSSETAIHPGLDNQAVSLQDIAPTIARAAGMGQLAFEGIALQDLSRTMPARRAIYMETGFDVPALKAELDISKVVEQGIAAYEISPDGLLQIRPEYHPVIVKNKQFGVTDGEYLLTTKSSDSAFSSSGTGVQVLEYASPTSVRPLQEYEWNQDVNSLSEQLFEYVRDPR